ncbi:armadillo-type protein [Staphylotrichum tortipilum]|uniref:Armadillo-type protein n=1 Tax=Staphylotrichum tortipilum TaxID=2831512 RepID=A0AAN6MQU2_9PEZI|nr:armadillo-type protein [Staphylotrichum longicolle]
MSSMAGLNMAPGFPPSAASQPSAGTGPRPHHHQRSKSSVLRSLMGGGHKRNNSDGATLPSAPLIAPIATTPAFHMSQQSLAPSRGSGVFHVGFDAAAAAAMEPQRYAHALGELQQNRQEQSPERRGRYCDDQPPPSPSKTGFSTISLRAFGGRSRSRDTSKPPKTRDNAANSPTKPKKAKSATNLAALLRPKSIKNLKQVLLDEGDTGKEKGKENQSPAPLLGNEHRVPMGPPPPIYAQFASQLDSPAGDPGSWRAGAAPASLGKKPRPKSFQAYMGRKESDRKGSAGSGNSDSHVKRPMWDKSGATGAVRPESASRGRSSGGAGPEGMPLIDPKDIDKHLEAMLDRRNIPENQRYKMRNLSDTIKMEFIRQDWAEMQAQLERPPSHDGHLPGHVAGAMGGPGTVASTEQQQDDNTASAATTTAAAAASPAKKEKKKHGRGLSLTLVRGSGGASAKSTPSSPAKKPRGDSSLGRHFRTKSSESLAAGSEPPSPSPFSSGGGLAALSSSAGSSFLAKVKGQQMPGDFVAYLRKVRRPELVEVGKLHKLRLLLRNETVAWTEEFIQLGGMREMVELLERIMGVEWREEHEDALLHENLLCLKALCTTDMALQYLDSIHATLFPALLRMIFDPEKKGPSEFTTRGIITSMLLTYIEAAPAQDRPGRARAVLGFLRDPEPKEDERPVDFVLEMRRDRPYRVWCKEVVNVTKEVFWIFLHNLNIVALPPSSAGADSSKPHHPPPLFHNHHEQQPLTSTHTASYMTRHFPQPRPPVPAAPYVGGVEWDATNYLASHLDLLNAIVACTGADGREGAEARNALRAELRVSGWERCLGGSLRLCKEKFYGAVHDGLRTWVAAASEDGWDVRDVRFGPPPPTTTTQAGTPKGKVPEKREAPRIEMPRLDFGIGGGMVGGVRGNEPWLS